MISFKLTYWKITFTEDAMSNHIKSLIANFDLLIHTKRVHFIFILNYKLKISDKNYFGPISHKHLYPYLHFEYKNVSERFKEAKILIPRFQFQNQNVNLGE